MTKRKAAEPPETKAIDYPYRFPDRTSIEELITLRGPALLLDAGEVLSPTEATAYFTFQPEHPCFVGHWEQHHIVPSYLWQELVGQAATLLLVQLDATKAPELVPTFVSVTAKFYGNVYPGDTVHITARLIGQPRWTVGNVVTGTVEGAVLGHRSTKPVAKVRLKFTALPRHAAFAPPKEK